MRGSIDEEQLLQRLRWRVAIGIPTDTVAASDDSLSEGRATFHRWPSAEAQRAIDDGTFIPAPPIPPTSVPIIDAFEDRTGVKLPPLLRRVYTEVADGGLGPGYGLPRFTDDGPEDAPPPDLEDGDLEYVFDKFRGWHAEGHLRGCDEPLIPLSDWGCAIRSFVTPSGRVWIFDPNDGIDAVDDDGRTLHEWFADWLDGTTRQV